ncbi:hypothetical protein J2S41_003514 [Catenuloplanes atrovinosus]|uniref:Uncharacterized protein n=1 Tax=Catenuloplanes atrovinosus TaxID=137266 RepID=A0AAE3YQF6_9ACTN|nr:hypothetical protein [Catenuloplanes atrovinosus]
MLADRERVLSPGHPDLAVTRASLALWRDAAASGEPG